MFIVMQIQKVIPAAPVSGYHDRTSGLTSAQERHVVTNLNEFLHLVLHQAQFNGFEFRRWFHAHIQTTWPGTEEAISILAGGDRYYALIFSHEFAKCYWRTGSRISFSVPSITYPRVNSRGEVIVVTRKPFTRRTIKPDVWKYHLRQMAGSDDPLAYLSRFLPSPTLPVPSESAGSSHAMHA